MKLLKRYPVTSFFVLAFAFAWGVRIPMALASIDVAPLKLLAEFGPTFAALSVTAALNGKAGVRALLGRVRAWRLNPWWYALVILGPAALQLAAIDVFVLFGGPGARFQFPGLVLPVILLIGFVLGLGEEIGWRGFALPHLQTRFHPVVASLIIGVLWSIWHIPGDLPTFISHPGLLAASSTYVAYLWFTGFTITGSILMAWVYNRTRGSIFLMALFHLGLSVFWQFVALPQAVGQFSPNDLSILLMGIAAVLVTVFTGAKRSAHARQIAGHTHQMTANT